jgi:hypothetical protein
MIHVGIILSLINFLTLKYLGPKRWGVEEPPVKE